MKHTLTISHCVILVVCSLCDRYEAYTYNFPLCNSGGAFCVCDRYEAHTYNFPLCPMAFGPVNPTFVWQVEAGICHVKVVFSCVFGHSFFFFFFFF